MIRLVLALLAGAVILGACSTSGGGAPAAATPTGGGGSPAAPTSTAGATATLGPSPTVQPTSTLGPAPSATASPPPSVGPSPMPSPTATAGPASPTPTPTAAAPSPSPVGTDPRVLVDLPVVACEVTDGSLEGPPPTPGMTVATIEAPASVTARSTWFGIESEELIFGPAGWTCDARIGADASERITLTSPSDPDARIVFEQYPGAPYVSVLELACPLFPAAAEELQSSFGTPCPKETVPAEMVTRPSEQVARFTDPAGVVGVGTGSGGRYPVHGGLVFHDAGGGLKVAYQVSCAMAPADEALCRYFVFDWVERLGFTAGPP